MTRAEATAFRERWPPLPVRRPAACPSKGRTVSILSVDTELLQLKSATVQATVDRISADVQAMKRGLEELQSSWRGAAAPDRYSPKIQAAIHSLSP